MSKRPRREPLPVRKDFRVRIAHSTPKEGVDIYLPRFERSLFALTRRLDEQRLASVGALASL